MKCLKHGEYSLEGQFTWGSNYTFLCNLTYGEFQFKTVYKPISGEKPLWDFPEYTLANREVAAFLMSEISNNNFVPPTVYREDGPNGAGSLQIFIDHDPEYHYLNFNDEDIKRARPIALFDAIINNTDRKGGHVLVGKENKKLWCIDHGVSFHADPKLRTVIWEFAGQSLDENETNLLNKLVIQLQSDSKFYQQLLAYISEVEIGAMMGRLLNLLKEKVFPHPTNNQMSYPWPPV